MKVSSAELPPRQVSLDIEVEQERLDRAMDEAYRRLAGRVDVPGFRRGKAPRSMVERMIGRDRIVEEALDELVPEVVTEAMEQEKVEPYTRPRVESIEFDPLRLKAVVGLAPKVELGDYKDNLRVPRRGGQRRRRAGRRGDSALARVVRPVGAGRAAGAAGRSRRPGPARRWSKGATSRCWTAKRPSTSSMPTGAQPAPGFAEQLVGLSAGRREDVHADHARRLSRHGGRRQAGRIHGQRCTGSRSASCRRSTTSSPSRLANTPTSPALRTAIETQLRQREEERVREQLEEAAMSKLVEISSIEFPPQLIDHQAQHMLETFTRNVEQQGLQLPQYLRLVGKEQDAFEQEIRDQAEDARATLAGAGRVRRRREDRRRAAGGRGRGAPRGRWRGGSRGGRAAGAGQSDHAAARAGSHARAQGDGAAAGAGHAATARMTASDGEQPEKTADAS